MAPPPLGSTANNPLFAALRHLLRGEQAGIQNQYSYNGGPPSPGRNMNF